MNKLLLLAILLIGIVTGISSVSAFNGNFGNGGPQFEYVPFENNSTNPHPNWHVEIHLPQNGAAVLYGILSDGNFTQLKMNVATMAVVDIYTTTQSPTMNYCPIANYILNNQDGYYDRIANMTQYVVPTWCYPELHPHTVPEYRWIAGALLGVAFIPVIIFTSKRFNQK